MARNGFGDNPFFARPTLACRPGRPNRRIRLRVSVARSQSRFSARSPTVPLLAAALSLPIVAAAALVGLVVGALQSATSVQDAALAHLPKLLVVAITTALLAPWIGHALTSFAARAFAG